MAISPNGREVVGLIFALVALLALVAVGGMAIWGAKGPKKQPNKLSDEDMKKWEQAKSMLLMELDAEDRVKWEKAKMLMEEETDELPNRMGPVRMPGVKPPIISQRPLMAANAGFEVGAPWRL